MVKLPNTSNSKSGTALRLDTSLPPPAPGRGGGRKLALLALLAVALTAFATYWLARTPEEKTALRGTASQMLNNALADTPLAGAGDLLASAPPGHPQPPVPPTAAGTLAGREISGTLATSLPSGPEAGAAGYAVPVRQEPDAPPQGASAMDTLGNLLGLETQPRQEPVIFAQEPLPPATEDSTLKPGNLNRVATWLVNHYRGGNGAGSIAATPQAFNQECGLVLGSAMRGGHKALLRYAFTPSMLSGLYGLYIDKFMEDLDQAAIKRGLSPEQNRQFHKALAGSAALLGRAVEGVGQLPALGDNLGAIDKLSREAAQANNRMASLISDLERQKAATNDPDSLATLQTRMEAAASAYREAEQRLGMARNDLASDIRQHAGPGLSDDSLLFIASWVYRRMQAGGDARGAIQNSLELLKDFANRCSRIAEAS